MSNKYSLYFAVDVPTIPESKIIDRIFAVPISLPGADKEPIDKPVMELPAVSLKDTEDPEVTSKDPTSS